MKKVILRLSIILFIGMYSCQVSGKTFSGVQVLKPEQFKTKMQELKNEIVLDVRAPKELAQGKIENAININFFDETFDAQIAKLDKTKPVMVYCAG